MSKELIGKTITGIWLADDQQAVKFDLLNGDSVVGYVDGDCCSHSWIENLEFPALGLPATVLNMQELDLPPDYYERHPGPPEEDSLQVYGYKVVTDRGEIVIDYRNESNGYYGGSIHWPSDEWGYTSFSETMTTNWKKVA